MKIQEVIVELSQSSNENHMVSEPALYYNNIFNQKFRLIQIIKNGMPFRFFHQIMMYCPFSEPEWAHFLNISLKTMQRARVDKELAEVSSLGIEAFGDENHFKEWLHTESMALNNYTPFDLIQDSYGKELVIDELNKIEHGVFA